MLYKHFLYKEAVFTKDDLDGQDIKDVDVGTGGFPTDNLRHLPSHAAGPGGASISKLDLEKVRRVLVDLQTGFQSVGPQDKHYI